MDEYRWSSQASDIFLEAKVTRRSWYSAKAMLYVDSRNWKGPIKIVTDHCVSSENCYGIVVSQESDLPASCQRHVQQS